MPELSRRENPIIDFIESKHEYGVGKRVLPSVTRVLVNMNLLHANADEADLQRGRAAHEACWMHDKGTLDPRSVDPIIEGYLGSWIALRASKHFRIVHFERKVASVLLGCAGRYDRDVVIDGEPYMLELKTGDIQELPVRLQLAIYAEMRRLELRTTRRKVEPFGRIAVRLFGDGRMAHMQRFPAVDYQRDLSGFLSALNLYRLKGAYENGN